MLPKLGSLLVIVVGLLVGASAEAQAVWKKLGSSSATTTVSRGGVALYDFTSTDSTGFSPLLQTVDCEAVTLSFDPDTASTGGSAEVYLYACVLGTTPSTNHCGKVLTDTDGDGLPDDATLTGADGTGSVAQRRFIYSVVGLPYLAIQRSAAATGGQAARAVLTCVSGG